MHLDVNGQMRNTEKRNVHLPRGKAFLLYLYAWKWYKNIGYAFHMPHLPELLSGMANTLWPCTGKKSK